MINKKVIDFGRAWTCENLDTLSPIDWEGYLILLSDGNFERIEYSDLKNYHIASNSEVKEYWQKKGYLYSGDQVEIIKGRKIPIGEIKTIHNFIHRDIIGTYGRKKYINVMFVDGTECSINNVKGLNADINTTPKEFRKSDMFIGGRL